MPIYAYRCQSCGFAKDVLQKMSDDVLTICPECNQSSFQKQVTAAGFQLKGSGWYVTDFRDGSKNGNNGNSNKPSETTPSQTEHPIKDVKTTTTDNQVDSNSPTSSPDSKVSSKIPNQTQTNSSSTAT
jgi:putative FmdB family regulatory protein